MKCPNCGEQIKSKKGMMNFCGFCGTNLKTGEKSWAAKEPAIASSLGLETKADSYNSQPSQASVSAPPVNSVPPQSYNTYSPVQPQPAPQSQVNYAKVNPPVQEQKSSFTQSYPEFQTTMPDPALRASFQTVAPPNVQETAQTIAPPPSFGSSASSASDDMSQSFFNSVSNDVNDISEQIGSIGSVADSVTDSVAEIAEIAEAAEAAAETAPVHKYEPVINVPQRNIDFHSGSSENNIKFMQYTRSSKDLTENENEDISSRFSAYNFNADTIASSEPSVQETPAEPEKPSQPAENTVSVPEISVPEPEPIPEPVPEPIPEPVIPKETIINFIGQNKSSVESMLRFKGLVPAFVYVTDESKYDTVISQSIPGGTEVETGTKIDITVSAGTWSEWSENPVPASSMRITETKTQYRRRNRTRTTDKRESSTPSGFEDYNLVDTTYKYSNWVTDQYFTSESVPLDNTCEIVTQATGFKYAGWFNPSNISAISFSTPDVANFFNNNMNINWMYDETISDQNIKPDVKNWRLANDSMASTPAGDSLTSNIFFSAHVINGKAYAMKFGSAETKWYVYRRRTLEDTIYHFEKEIISDWSDWSDWTDQEYTANDDCEVQSRTLSRSRRKNSSELENE